jgi:hypothetical protein
MKFPFLFSFLHVHAIRLTLALGLLSLLAAPISAQLAPEIEADRLLLRAKEQMERNEWGAAAQTMQRITTLKVSRPVEFDYYYARALSKSGNYALAEDTITRFLNQAGRGHELYAQALEIYNEVEPKASADRQERARKAQWDAFVKQANEEGAVWLRSASTRKIEDIGMQLQPIPPGVFQLQNGPWVHITRGFWLGKTEVTNGQWRAIMGWDERKHHGHVDALGRKYDWDRSTRRAWREQSNRQNDPVVLVSWEEAMEFCRRLTERERAAGRLPAGYAYTLPTEAQWEYACGPDPTPLTDYAWYSVNSNNTTQAVGGKKANAFGLHDMLGNVWEWSLDWYGDYPRSTTALKDYAGPSSGSFRVDRGGGWGRDASRCRSSHRSYLPPGGRGYDLGFRAALSSVP